MAYEDDILSLSPVHYWTLNGNTNDTGTGTALTGTRNGASFVSGIRNGAAQALSFNRGTNNLQWVSSADLNGSSYSQRTISMVLKPELDTLPFPLLGTGGANGGMQTWMAAGMVPAVSLTGGGSTSTVFSRAIKINEPSVLTFVFDSGTLSIYIDGRLITVGSCPTVADSATQAANFGGAGTYPYSVPVNTGSFGTYSLAAIVSDVAVWDRALTESEIFNLVFSGAAIPTTATCTFTDVPAKTEIRIYDRDNGLSEIGSGIEFLANAGDVSFDYTVTTELNARFALVNVEDRFKIVHSDVALPREGDSFPANLLLLIDRVYDNDFIQTFAPNSTVPPVIDGLPEQGQSLSVTSNGQWGIGSPPITFTYQWLRDALPISGATSSSYVITSGDLDSIITCEVTATNVAGSAVSSSNAISLLQRAQFAVWTATNSATPSTIATTINFSTEQINTGGFANTGGVLTPPAGRYLVWYQACVIGSGANGRGNAVVRLRRGGSVIDGGHGSGYQRDTANDAWWANGASIVECDGTQSIDVQMFRDTDANTGSLTQPRSFLGIAKIGNSGAFSHYAAAAGGFYGATTYAQVSLNSTLTETAPAVISRSGSNITLAPNRSYMVTGGCFFELTTARTARFTRFSLDGAHVAGSTGYAYLRSSADEYGAPSSFAIIETGASSSVLSLDARGVGVGGTSVEGNAQLSSGGIMISELPATALYSATFDSQMGQDLAAIQTDVAVMRSAARDDLFSTRTATNAQFAGDGDYFVAAGIMARRNSAGTTRLTREARFLLDDIEQTQTVTGEYNRGDQGSQDVYDNAWSPRGAMPNVLAGQTIRLSVDKSQDAGWNDGSSTITTDEAAGLYVVDLASLG